MLYTILKYPVKIISIIFATLLIWIPLVLMIGFADDFKEYCEGIKDWYKVFWDDNV